MAKLKSGDRVECCVKCNNIVSPYSADYEEIITFEIIAAPIEYSYYSDYSESVGYFLFVPCYKVLIRNLLVNKPYTSRRT